MQLTAQEVVRIRLHLDDQERNGLCGAVLIATAEQVVLDRTCGFGAAEAAVPATHEIVFDIGSVTKTFTAAAILRMEMDGLLVTDQPLGTLFRKVPEDKADITIHHLLTHSSGLPDFVAPNGVSRAFTSDTDFEPVSRSELLARIWNARLDNPPGARWSYSNVGYSLLAAVVEMISGRTYDSYLRDALLRPLGMDSTGYLTARSNPQRVAVGYAGTQSVGRPTDKLWDSDGPYWNLRGNGGLLSTGQDLFRWRRVLSSSVLSRDACQKMLQPHVIVDKPLDIFCTCGWYVRSSRVAESDTMVFHNGSNGVFTATIRWFPKRDRYLVVLCNRSEFSATQLAKSIVRLWDPVT